MTIHAPVSAAQLLHLLAWNMPAPYHDRAHGNAWDDDVSTTPAAEHAIARVEKAASSPPPESPGGRCTGAAGREAEEPTFLARRPHP